MALDIVKSVSSCLRWERVKGELHFIVVQDGVLHVCIFNKDFTRLESYFKIEILVESCSPHELSINR